MNVTYSFLSSAPAYYPPDAAERGTFQPLTSSEQEGTRRAFTEFAEVANISFTELAGVGALTLGSARLDAEIQAYAYYPNRTEGYQEQGDIWLNTYWANNNDQTPGSWGYMTMLHEIGHAVGLKHSFEADYGRPVLPAAEDTTQWTVMSYASAPLADVNPRTLQLYDIAALQYLYGANMATRAGNDRYSWADGEHVLETIWDGGGIDTIDAGNQHAAVSIDLREGAFSNIGALKSNIAIAYSAAIENAVGGSGSDLIVGNTGGNLLIGGPGDDYLQGLGGDDLLTGGRGADTLLGGSGEDSASYAQDPAGIVVDLRTAIGVDGWGGHDTVGAERIEGSAFADRIIGNMESNRLSGGSGDDFLSGAAGEDLLSGGPGRDVASYAEDPNGIAVQLNLLIGRDGWGRIDSLDGVEDVIGSHYDDDIIGDGSNNALLGGAGRDRLRGMESADSLDGGAGFDEVSYARDPAGISLNLESGIATDGWGTEDVLRGIEHVEGSVHADWISGDNEANNLSPRAGDDVVSGLGGPDVFVLHRGIGHDLVTDFEVGLGLGDRMFVGRDNGGLGVSSFADILGRTHDDDGNVIIDFGAGDAVTLLCVHKAQLAADDFLFG